MNDIYQPTDIILAKVKGYPAWPAMIVPNELIPEHVLRNRSRNQAKTTNGKAAHNDSGSNEEKHESVNDQLDEAETFDDADSDKYITYSNILKFRKFDDLKSQYCVKFFCDDSYIWLKPLDMKPLTAQQCTEWLSSSKKKNKRLIPAYEMASKGSGGIDVWEFIEYGSAGKPDEEEYVQEYEEDDEEEEPPKSSTEEYEDEEETGTRKRSRGKTERSSVRQRQKRQRETQSVRASRATRSRKAKNTHEEPEASEEEAEISAEEGVVVPKTKRAKRNAKVEPKSKSKNKAKAPTKRAPITPKYHYEDDMDWSIVGLGPQDLSIDKNVSSLVNKLSLKRNLDRHSELKSDLMERLMGVNKLLLELLIPQTKGTKAPLKDDYEAVVDELDVALSVKGAHDEFITVFQSSNELLLNFRILFNLRRSELQDWDLWDQFQGIFSSIYEYKFIPDTNLWSEDKNSKQIACREELIMDAGDITNDQKAESQA